MRAWHHVVVVAGIWIGVSAVAGAQFWERESASDWSDSEVEALLTDSPWSHGVRINTPNTSLAGRVGGLSGGVVGAGAGSRAGTGAGGGAGGAGAGNLGGGSFLGLPERTRLIVRWASALPVRQAAARRDGAPVPDREASNYRISVAGIPRPLAEELVSLDAVRDATTLRVGSRGDRSPIDILVGYEGEQLAIDWYFSRDDPIVAADGEVVFTTQLGSLGIERSFDLSDMTLDGQPAL